MKSKFLPYIIAAITSLCGICAIGALAIIVNENIISTPTPASLLPQPNFSTIIVQTAAAAQTQTMLAMPPTPLATATLAPLIEIPATPTIFIFSLQTDVAQPTDFIFSTDTPFTLPTQIVQQTQPPSNNNCEPAYPGVCINGNPRLSCADLRPLGIFHFRVLAPDPLGYDRDNDGIGCE